MSVTLSRISLGLWGNVKEYGKPGGPLMTLYYAECIAKAFSRGNNGVTKHRQQ